MSKCLKKRIVTESFIANSPSKIQIRSADTETHYNIMTFIFSEEL